MITIESKVSFTNLQLIDSEEKFPKSLLLVKGKGNSLKLNGCKILSPGIDSTTSFNVPHFPCVGSIDGANLSLTGSKITATAKACIGSFPKGESNKESISVKESQLEGKFIFTTARGQGLSQLSIEQSNLKAAYLLPSNKASGKVEIHLKNSNIEAKITPNPVEFELGKNLSIVEEGSTFTPPPDKLPYLERR